MILFHFTSARHLRGIACYGLTVGDVPTDIHRCRGRVGVWLTSAATAGGHGLEGSLADKTRYRLSIEVPDGSPQLVKWLDWAAKNVTPATIAALHSAAAKPGAQNGPDSWYVFFGVLPPLTIRSCVDMATGAEVQNWSDLSSPELDVSAVPGWRRNEWHRQLLKKMQRQMKR
jgi:hypothetical protein